MGLEIHRTKVVRVGALGDTERARLRPILTDIFLQSFEFADAEMVADRVIFRDPAVKLALFYDRRGVIVGFMSLGIGIYRVGGREHAAVDSGMYVVPQLRGTGIRAIRWGIREALAFKLRHPLVPLAWVGAVTSPIPYQRLTQFAQIHPRRGVPIPAEIEALVGAVMEARGYLRVEADDPWRVHVGLPFRLREPERLERFLGRHPSVDMDFFVARNPGYAEGEWLVGYASFEPWYLLATAVPWLQRWVGNRG